MIMPRDALGLRIREVGFVGAGDAREHCGLQPGDAGPDIEQVLVGRRRFHVGKPQRLVLGRAARRFCQRKR